jgi:hypothetical protein
MQSEASLIQERLGPERWPAGMVAGQCRAFWANVNSDVRRSRSYFARGLYGLGAIRSAALMVRFTSVIIALHTLQILLSAGLYRWCCIPSYGSGDLLLPGVWRTLGAIESITGVLMCGLSATLLFAIVMRCQGRRKTEPFSAR